MDPKNDSKKLHQIDEENDTVSKLSDEYELSESPAIDADTGDMGGVDDAIAAAPTAIPPKTRYKMITAINEKLMKMKKEELKELSKSILDESIDFEDDDDDISMFDEELGILANMDESLSEEFRKKATVIFEAAVNSKVSKRVKELEANYPEVIQQVLEEEKKELYSDLEGKIDSYLNYVVESWVEENRLAVENGLRTQLSESFIGALKNVFTDHYIDVPESKVDLVDELTEQVESLESKLNKSISHAIELKEQVQQLNREKIIREQSFDLSESQLEKLKDISESVAYESDSQFASKLALLKESYFSNDTRNTKSVEQLTDSMLYEEVEYTAPDDEITVSDTMRKYLSALKKTN